MKSTKIKGMAKGDNMEPKGFAKAGMAVPGGPQGTVTSQPVRKTVSGDKVQVRGVGAARARTATIY